MRVKRTAPPRLLAVQKSEETKTAAESPAASAFRLDGIGRHDRSLPHTFSMPESRVTLEKLNMRPWWNWQTRWI